MIREITQMQSTCLTLAAQGMTAKQAGRELGLSEYTVKDHWQAASIRLGATNKTHAVALALASGQISAADVEVA
jgi:DNA-binding CsgD family transcriptional regulator